jgi:hypothetical protein
LLLGIVPKKLFVEFTPDLADNNVFRGPNLLAWLRYGLKKLFDLK